MTRLAKSWIVSLVAAALSIMAFPSSAQVMATRSVATVKSINEMEVTPGTSTNLLRVRDGALIRAQAFMAREARFYTKEDIAAKQSANLASDGASRSLIAPQAGGATREAPEAFEGAAPAIVVAFNKPGLAPSTSDIYCNFRDLNAMTGAVGPLSYIQFAGCGAGTAGIFNKVSGAAIVSRPWVTLADTLLTNFERVASFQPQIIWDPTTDRYYYTLDLYLAADPCCCAGDNCFFDVLVYGFSRTANPIDFSNSSWCRYAYWLDHENLVDPQLGDSNDFAIIGVASYHSSGGYFGPKILALGKPPAGTNCPAQNELAYGLSPPLTAPGGGFVVAPAPANQIDKYATGNVVARNPTTPSNKIWLFSVTRDPSTGGPIFGPARGITVAPYAVPPDATQPQFSQKLRTLDARFTQAVQGVDGRLKKHALWTQHTIRYGRFGAYSTVRWYEIDPIPATPVVLRSGVTSQPSTRAFHYNGAISSDRRRDGAQGGFGDNFVVAFNQSSAALNLSPRILAGLSVNGGPLSFRVIRNAVGPYKDGSCAAEGSTCNWGSMASATPDPRPTVAGHGLVWGASAYSGVATPPPTGVNWRTQLFAVQP